MSIYDRRARGIHLRGSSFSSQKCPASVIVTIVLVNWSRSREASITCITSNANRFLLPPASIEITAPHACNRLDNALRQESGWRPVSCLIKKT